MVRADKLLAATGRWSRREVKQLCRAGRVTADGVVLRTGEEKVAEEAAVMVDGLPVERAQGPVWLMLHKPAGVVSATEDPREPTVLSLLPEPYRKMGLFPVGRLDKDTEGLLLLTNDGPLAHALLSPKRHVDKVYYMETEGCLDEDDVRAFQAGMVLGDGLHCLPAGLRLLGENRGEATLREGKYHQVKRMAAARGKPVRYLKRTAFGPLRLDETLEKGAWRPLSGEERGLLARAVGQGE